MRRHLFSSHKPYCAVALVAGFLTGFGGWAASNEAAQVVSQKGRHFTPASVSIKRGQALTIVNDDADLSHHAYISADNFNFDSGDQKPGSRTNVAFPVAGTFDVLCAIHPKMKLTVKVE